MEIFSCSDIFLLQMHLLYVQWCGSNWVQKVFEIRSPYAKVASLLSKTPFWSLIDLAITVFTVKVPVVLPEYFVKLTLIGM